MQQMIKAGTVRCAHCGQTIRPKGKKRQMPAAFTNVAATEPKTILSQYRQLLEHRPEVINGLLLH